MASERAIASSPRLGLLNYVAVGLANRAWAALSEGDLDSARADAGHADGILAHDAPLPFRWLSIWPLFAVDVADGHPSAAVQRCAALLDPTQQPPAGPVGHALGAVMRAAGGPPEDLRTALAYALDRAREHGYL